MKVLSQTTKAIMATLLLHLALITQAQAVAPDVLTFSDNSIQAKFEFSQQVGLTVKVEFDNAVGLNANTVDISAEVLSPASLAIVNRLPTSLISAPGAFPVMLSIQPKTDKGFAFEGVAMVELYTKALHYTPGTPLRLFRSHDKGTFEDITLLTASGSFRARGNTGSFSDFIVMLDTRPQTEVISSKFAKLNHLISSNHSGIDGSLLVALESLMAPLDVAIGSSHYNGALDAVDSLIDLISAAEGAQIDDVWRSANDITNVKGELLTRLHTLRYSLRTL